MIILFSRRSPTERVSVCGASPIGASGSSIVMDAHSLQNSGRLPFVHKSWQRRENLLKEPQKSEFQRNVKQHDREALWPKIKQPNSTNLKE